MILSKKNKFLFVKGRKVAGTSLEVMLSALCGPEDIITPITSIDEQYRISEYNRGAQNFGLDAKTHDEYINRLMTSPKEDLGKIKAPQSTFYNHMSLSEITQKYGEIPEDWTKFAIVRNPYSAIISLVNMQRNFSQYRKTGTMMKSSREEIQLAISQLIRSKKIGRVRNINLYKNPDGEIDLEILRYENINEDVDQLMTKMNITDYPKLGHFKAGLSSDDLDIKSYFNSKQLQFINRVYREVFERYGYEMLV